MTTANIDAQEFVIRGYRGAFDVILSVVVGTGVGLVVKYILDKRYLFRFHARNAIHDGQTSALYTLLELATTVVSWGFEFDFHPLFKTKEMRYFGGVISLTIGYLTNYHLTERFVFRVEEI